MKDQIIKLSDESKDILIRLINRELFSVINNKEMLNWAKKDYLEKLINLKKEIGD